MSNFLLILKYLKNYKLYAGLNIAFNLLFVVFSIFSLATVIPFLNIIFEQTEPVYEKPEFKLSLNVLLDTFSYYLTIIIDNYESKEAGLVFISMVVIVTFFFKNLFRYLARHFVIPIRNGVVRDIRIELNDKILSLPLSYFNKNKKGDLVSTLTSDVVEVENSILSVLEVLIKEPVTIIAFMATLFAINPSLTLFVLFLIILIAVFVGGLGRTLKKSSFEGQNKLGFITSLYDETISGMRIIKAFTAEKFRKKQFGDETLIFNNIMNKVLRKRDLSSPLTEVLGVMIFSSVIWFGGKEVLNSTIEPSVLIFYLISFAYIIAPAKSFSTAYYNVQKGLGSVERINKILFESAEIKDPENPLSIADFKDAVEFKNVSFSYNNFDSREILSDVTFSLKKGNVLALVGPSGAGKTTIADLLPRFYEVDNGSIAIDGVDIKQYKKHDLRKLMGVVSQESILFNDTVKNNIAFGTNASDDAIIEAAKAANAHDFIMQLPQGYNTVIGDRGQNLSGGQKQRLTIARAILKNPPILILDEATSALDSESEKLVQEALIKLMRNRTSVVIAHRLSTIQFADEILVIDQGKIVEKGNHISLMSKNGLYKKLVELQAF